MKSGILWIRRAGVAGLAGLTATAGAIALAPSAYGAVSGAYDLAVADAPTIAVGSTAATGTITLTPAAAAGATGTFNIGDAFTVTLPAGGCTTADESVGFSALPTVTAALPTGAPAGAVLPTFNVTADPTAACAALGIVDQVAITATNLGSGTATITIGASVTVGADFATGDLTATVAADPNAAAGTPSTYTVAPLTVDIATVENVTFTTTPVGTTPGTTTATGNLVVTEAVPGVITAGTLCFALPAAPAELVFAGTPTAAVSGGDAVIGTATIGGAGKVLSVPVTTAGTTGASTFTVSGVTVTVPATAAGTVPVTAGTNAPTCNNISTGVPYLQVTAVARLAGSDRYATAALPFQDPDVFGCGVGNTAVNTNVGGVVVLSRGDQFADALAGSYLAGQFGTGLLLTDPNGIPTATMGAMKGINTVYVLGGPAAVSEAVVDQLEGMQVIGCNGVPVVADGSPVMTTVVRISGNDRFQTAAAVATFLPAGTTPPGTADIDGGDPAGPQPTAILANGLNFPDALAAGPIAYAGSEGAGNNNGFPLLLTAPEGLSGPARDAILSLGITQVIIPGGTTAVSAAVETDLAAAGVLNVVRLAGVDRTETAALIAGLATAGGTDGLNYDDDTVWLARGDAFADALAGGPVAGAGADPTPLLLTFSPTDLGAGTAAYLADSAVEAIGVFGGTAAVDPGTVQAALNALIPAAMPAP